MRPELVSSAPFAPPTRPRSSRRARGSWRRGSAGATKAGRTSRSGRRASRAAAGSRRSRWRTAGRRRASAIPAGTRSCSSPRAGRYSSFIGSVPAPAAGGPCSGLRATRGAAGRRQFAYRRDTWVRSVQKPVELPPRGIQHRGRRLGLQSARDRDLARQTRGRRPGRSRPALLRRSSRRSWSTRPNGSRLSPQPPAGRDRGVVGGRRTLVGCDDGHVAAEPERRDRRRPARRRALPARLQPHGERPLATRARRVARRSELATRRHAGRRRRRVLVPRADPGARRSPARHLHVAAAADPACGLGSGEINGPPRRAP